MKCRPAICSYPLDLRCGTLNALGPLARDVDVILSRLPLKTHTQRRPPHIPIASRSMSGKRRTLGSFLRRDHQPRPPTPSPPSSPVPRRNPDAPPGDEKVISPEGLQSSVESLEMVLRSMDNVRDQLNRYNLALREHANTLRQYAVNINMLAVTDDRGRNQGDDRVYEYLMLHSANYYDRYAESQEQLVFLVSSLLT